LSNVYSANIAPKYINQELDECNQSCRLIRVSSLHMAEPAPMYIIKMWKNHRIIESFGLEGTPRGHLVQPQEAAGRAGELPMIRLQHWGIHLRAALGRAVVPLSLCLYINIKARC